MATKKDLVEAHAFSRRRLVTAFVSGAPGGREVEPTRPGRTIIGGAALAVLLLAGAAIAGVFKPDVDIDWDQPGLVQSKEKGASYVILEPDEDGNPQVRPVINITSAQLILGEENAVPEVVPQSEIDTNTPGADIGILGAPVTVPETDDLIQTGWTACTDDGLGLHLDVSETDRVTAAPDAGLLVKSQGSFYVIAQSRPEGTELSRAYSYALPKNLPGLDNTLRALGLPILEQAKVVPADWLALFPRGGSLDFASFGLAGFGEVSDQAGQGGLPDDARIGDYYEIDGQLFVVTQDGPAQFSEFARAVYLDARLPRVARDLGLTSPPDVTAGVEPYLDADWPGAVLRPVVGEQCARLEPEFGSVPGVVLVELPEDEASAAEVEGGQRDVTVDPGKGAFVLSGGWESSQVGEPFVIDAKGYSYALIGTDAVTNLGFGDDDAPVVPDSWLELFVEGEALSVDAALCPPTRPEELGQGAEDEQAGESRSCE